MNLGKVVSDTLTLETDVLALAGNPAVEKIAVDVTILLADLGIESSIAAAGGPFDRFGDFTTAIRDYREERINGDQLVAGLGIAHIGRTPNPQRICTAIAIANVIGPIVESMMTPPGHWTPIPLPPFCTAPTPSTAVAGSVSVAELQRVTAAVVAGMFD